MMGGGCRIAGGEDREGALAGDGWTRRAVAAPSRRDELTALYRQLGFDIRLEPIELDAMDSCCAGCAPDLADCHAIYTRPGDWRKS
jgi:hypothetical protein